MRILLIEDELAQLKRLKKTITEAYPKDTITTASNFEEARLRISESEFDIGIFDVMIGTQSIFEILKGIKLQNKQMIFLTGNNSFAIQAFECYAVDYILKPFSEERLHQSIQIANKRLLKDSQIQNDSQYNTLVQSIVNQSIDSISLPNISGMKLVLLKDIVAIEAERSYCTFHLSNRETITISKSLAWVEQKLLPLGFFRCHRSWLVNQKHVTEFLKQNGYSLKMTSGLIVSVTERARVKVMDWIRSFSISD